MATRVSTGFGKSARETSFKTLGFAVCAFACLGGWAMGATEAERIAASRAVAAEFMAELKGELVSALKEAGPVHAVSACNRKAPDIAARKSRETGWDVGRTSLRVRNPANAPDAWERSVLERFEELKAKGEDAKTIEYGEVVEQNGRKVFRYMQAIPTVGLCLTCHGDHLDAALEKKLREIYPEDKATGFRVGDIRGAFSISQPVDEK